MPNSQWDAIKALARRYLFEPGFFIRASLLVGATAGAGFVVLKSGLFPILIQTLTKYSEFSALIVGALIVLGAVASAMLTYLKTETSDTTPLVPQKELFGTRIAMLEQQLNSVQSRLEGVTSPRDSASFELLANELEARFAVAALKKTRFRERRARWRAIEKRFDASRRRLAEEVAALGRRGNLNLVLGTSSTLIALGVLWYIVAFSPAWQKEEQVKFMAYFGVRLAVVLLIETFAFFFLRLYRSSLTELKYFQNELTTLEMQVMAYLAAVASKNEASLKMAIASLIKTERNFILKKGESTVELERLRTEQDSTKSLLSAASRTLVNAAKKEN